MHLWPARDSRRSHFVGLLSLAFLSTAPIACSIRQGVEQVALGVDVRRTADIVYGDRSRARLDVYRVRGAPAGLPVVVFIYGGRWQSGSRRDYLLAAATMARRGWIVVVPDYRLYPETLFPGWMDDVAQAVRWTVDSISRFGGDRRRLFLVGHSAGAHIATLLALDGRYFAAAGVPPGAVRGVVSLAGPVASAWTDRDVQAVMGPPAGWPATYPLEFASGMAPPLLLLHGTGDETVRPANSTRLAERIVARGGCARARLYPTLSHVRIVVALAVPSSTVAPVLDDVAHFIRDPEGEACDARRLP